MSKRPEHRCPQCGRPDCSLPDPSTFGVPNWILALVVILAAVAVDLVYTYTIR